jgi:hypothetical protein
MDQGQLPGWDPLTGKVQQTLEKQLAARVWLWMNIGRRGLGVLLAAMAIALAGAAVVVLAVSWPWTTPGPNYSGVVVGSATATAFASVFLSVVTVPFRAATEFASGYAAVVLRSPIPWALAAGQVLVAAFLFTLAALGPTQHAAVASGLLAAAVFAVVWFSSRSILASSDPYEMATRYVAYLTKARGRSRKVILAQTKRMLRRKRRSPALIELLAAPTQDSTSAAFLIQFGEGMRSAFARGQAAAALTLWQGCVTLFVEHAQDRHGAVGDYGGVTQALLELAEEAVERAEANQLYGASAQVLRALGALAKVRPTSIQYAMVLTTTRDLLSRQIDKKWDDERSFVPNAAAATIAAMAMSCFENLALDDGTRGLTVLGELATKATISRKVHISVAAIDGFVRAL